MPCPCSQIFVNGETRCLVYIFGFCKWAQIIKNYYGQHIYTALYHEILSAGSYFGFKLTFPKFVSNASQSISLSVNQPVSYNQFLCICEENSEMFFLQLSDVMEGGGGIDEELRWCISCQTKFWGRCLFRCAGCRGLGPRQVLMAPVLLVTTLRWTVASLARCTPPTPHRLD